MPNPKILIISSTYYKDLAEKHLSHCVKLFNNSNYDYEIEYLNAGTYEIPAAIRYFHHNKPFDGYIPLGLLLKGSTDHYEFIWEHVKECFIQFAMQGILLGNGIISAPSLEVLTTRVDNGERVLEAYNAVDYLIKLTSARN